MEANDPRPTRDRPAGDPRKIREEAAVEERWQNLKNRTFSIRLAWKKAVRSIGRTAYMYVLCPSLNAF